MRYVLSLIIALMLIGCISDPQDDQDPVSSSSRAASSSSAKKITIQSSSSQIPIVLSSSSAQITIGDICDIAWVDVYKSRNFSSLNEFCIAYKKYLTTVIPDIKTSHLDYCIAREECTGLTEEKPKTSGAYESCMKTCEQSVCNSASGAAMGRNNCSSYISASCSAGCASLR